MALSQCCNNMLGWLLVSLTAIFCKDNISSESVWKDFRLYLANLALRFSDINMYQ